MNLNSLRSMIKTPFFKKIQICRKSILVVLIFAKSGFVFSYTLDDYAKNQFGNVLFIRHTLAPGFGDPHNFDLNDCSTQRNLDEEGREQASLIGKKFKAKGIKFSKIYSSQWCRCIETAENMDHGKINYEPGMNSFFQGIVPKDITLSKLRQRPELIRSKKELVLMVTHQVTITAVTGIYVLSGGAVAFNTESGESREIIIFN